MTELTRKERNFLQREQELTQIALNIMHDDGFAGLTMEKLAIRSEYSKGTIYNHFTCKEDVLSAIGIACLDELDSLFSRALQFSGNTRERLIAIHFAYMLNARLNAEQFMCVLSCKTSTVAEKASEKHQQLSISKETQLLKLLNSLVEEAQINGELIISPHSSVDSITFCTWSMSFGTLALLIRAEDAQLIKRLDAQQAMLSNICVTLDGLAWQPLSDQWDYQHTIERIKTEIFAKEIALLTQLDAKEQTE